MDEKEDKGMEYIKLIEDNSEPADLDEAINNDGAVSAASDRIPGVISINVNLEIGVQLRQAITDR